MKKDVIQTRKRKSKLRIVDGVAVPSIRSVVNLSLVKQESVSGDSHSMSTNNNTSDQKKGKIPIGESSAVVAGLLANGHSVKVANSDKCENEEEEEGKLFFRG